MNKKGNWHKIADTPFFCYCCYYLFFFLFFKMQIIKPINRHETKNWNSEKEYNKHNVLQKWKRFVLSLLPGGYLLCTDRITFIDSFQAVPNYVVVVFMLFCVFLVRNQNQMVGYLFLKNYYKHFRMQTVLVHTAQDFLLLFLFLFSLLSHRV